MVEVLALDDGSCSFNSYIASSTLDLIFLGDLSKLHATSRERPRSEINTGERYLNRSL